jgi:TonB family protein
MKTTFTTFLFSFIVFATTAQELKKVKKTLVSNPFTHEWEEYHVLKSDKKIKHGPYQRLVNDKVTETGFYKDNQKDSTWTKFFFSSGTIREQGLYEKNQRVGMWKFYDSKNELEQSYDFSTQKLIVSGPDSKPKMGWVITETDTLETILDSPAMYLGGTATYGEIMAKNLRFPISAARRGIQGRVYVTFVIDQNGRASGHKVSKPIDKDCDEEALRVCRMLTEWIPASKDGKPVKSLHMIPVSFNFGGIGIIR